MASPHLRNHAVDQRAARRVCVAATSAAASANQRTSSLSHAHPFSGAQLLQLVFRIEEGELMWNKDEVRGKADQVKGKIKESVGNATDDDQLRDEGAADNAAGNVEETLGKARRKVGEALNDLGDKIGR